PNKRDFFVYNLIGDEAKPGLGIYANASGLAIHDIRASIETGKDRVINFQSHPDARLHRVDQHLVKMVRLVETEREVPFTRTRTKGPTVPKNVIQVEFPPTYTRQSRTLKLGSGGVLIPTQGKIPDRQFDTAIAHELGHTNNIYHHGDVDLKEVEWQADGADIAEVSPAGTTKPLRLFDDTPAMNEFFIPSAKLPFKVYIAKTGGQHSGNVGCLMRYAFAHATVSVADPKYRLFPSDPETLGQALCTSRTGTNINAPGRIPHPRYGDAAPNRGNCLHQVCVNDFFDNHAPR
ncbi:hypothetical protein, partial [Archangium sp.]|uniref:hypothetical protein n=1 Tax=Archangium sp. TaxID=1872627 RepID=UPI002ED9777E